MTNRFHINHVGFTIELAEPLSLPIISPHENNQRLLERLDEYGEILGLPLPHSDNIQTGQWLKANG